MLGKLIFLNGITGTGKTSIGNLLQKSLKNSVVIDQDSFYNKNKPLITLIAPNDNKYDASFITSNWDCDESINFVLFNNSIKCNLTKYDYVIVTGFSLRSNLMTIMPDLSFLLIHNMSDDLIQEKIIESRRQAKGFQGVKAERDIIMVKTVIMPYYKETLTKLYDSHSIDVYSVESGERIDKNNILNKILSYI